MRIKGLDFLRGIAIAGVLLRHSHLENVLEVAGGYGVDLFFVLSGFLVSGLLFNEYKKTGKADIGRFLIRRGFKIYPAFYFYIAVSILTDLFFFKTRIHGICVVSEVFFMQNYGYPFRYHTWSLALEEHFYLFLSLFVLCVIKLKQLENKKAIINFLAAAIALITVFRLAFVIQLDGRHEAFFATHLRGDGLFMGALLSYLWHFKRNWIERIYRHRYTFYLLAALLVSPAFLFDPGGFFMLTFGFNFLHTGFAVFILLLADENHESVIFTNRYLKRMANVICFLGVNSYSIYLWHLLVEDVLDVTITNLIINEIMFFVVSIGIGILSALFVEKSFLKIRERYFPRTTENNFYVTENLPPEISIRGIPVK